MIQSIEDMIRNNEVLHKELEAQNKMLKELIKRLDKSLVVSILSLHALKKETKQCVKN